MRYSQERFDCSDNVIDAVDAVEETDEHDWKMLMTRMPDIAWSELRFSHKAACDQSGKYRDLSGSFS